MSARRVWHHIAGDFWGWIALVLVIAEEDVIGRARKAADRRWQRHFDRWIKEADRG